MNPVYITSSIYLALIVACLLALTRRGKYEAVVRRVEHFFWRLAASPRLSLLALFFGVVLLRLALIPLLAIPTPEKHDEFSYLLLGDTLAHGRLTNPTHPLSESFETFHVLFSPTYCSKYPPAQGAIMAIGELLGNPWFGVLLSAAFMAAVFCWALRPWMPGRWACFAAFLAAAKLCFTTYWVNSFWGGAAAAIGGALAIGGLARILRRPSSTAAVALGLGISLLANSRPYEGAAFCLPIVAALLWWVVGKTKQKATFSMRLRSVLLPLGVILAVNFVFMGYYNWRLTGNARTIPLTVYEKRYNPGAIFLWESPKPPMQESNREFDVFYNTWVRDLYRPSWTYVKAVTLRKVRLFATLYLWWDLVLVVPALYFLIKRKKLYLLCAAFVSTIAAFLCLAWVLPHYIAPAVCIVFAIIVTAIRHLRLCEPRGLQLGVFLSRLVVLGLLLQTANDVVTQNEDSIGAGGVRMEDRVAVIKKLEALPGKHLVIVRYSSNHNVHNEWVYNSADIDGSKIVWARELDNAQNLRLREYFRDRTVWIIQPDRMSPQLQPASNN
ncbi:MAG: hypothetical protein NVS9B14_16280 [Candidatus Acidiferrum sp.]